VIASFFAPLLLAISMSPREQDEVDRHVRRILADAPYGFCHDEAYPLTWDEVEWCPLVQDNPRCPALEHACKAPRAELVGPPGRLSRRTVSKDDAPQQRAEGPDRRREPEPTEVEIPALGGFAELLFWFIVVAGVLALVLAIARNLAKGKGPEATPEREGDAAKTAADVAAAAARRAMETDVDRLLAMASDCAARGEFADAVDFSHAALLRRLDHDGLIRLHRARTNGDYVQDLRSNADLYTPVRDALRRIDRAQFGTEPPQRPMFEDIFARITAIVKRAGPVAVLALVVGMLSLACDPEGEGGKSYPWPRSPSGTDGVLELLRARGFEAEQRVGALDAFGDDTQHGALVVVMLGDSGATEAEWKAIDEWVQGGGRLVLAGAHIPPWLDATIQYDSAADTIAPTRVTDEFAGSYPVPYVMVPETAVLSTANDHVLLARDDDPYAVRYDRGAGTVVVLADDNLFINATLPVADNAIFLESLLRDLGRRVEFVDAWADIGADDPFESIRRTHLTAAVVQLLLLIIALYLWRGIRFGRPRDPIPPSRRAFVQHAVAMGHQYGRARATGHAAAAYAGWVLDRLRDRYPIAAAAGLHGLAQHVAARSSRDDTEVMRLLVEAHGAVESRTGVGSPGEDLALVRDLGRLMRELSFGNEKGGRR
jgi:hypothetical protein